MLIFLIIQLNQIKNTDFVKSNPTPVNTIGGILPQENLTLSLVNAEVLFEINALNFPKFLSWKFKSNYTLFNPDDTINVTIAIPFYPFNSISNASLTVDNNLTLYSLEYDTPFNSEIWNKYIENIGDERWAFLFNITIPKNNSVLINFSFESIENGLRYMIKEFGPYEIIYDVGTSRVWNANITEKVGFKVYGQLPDYCYHEEDCNVSNIENDKILRFGIEPDKRFIWEWNNEIIEYNLVGIVYTSLPKSNLVLISLSLFGLGNVIAAVILIYFFKVKKREKSLQM